MRTLTAGNRQLALDFSGSDSASAEAVLASSLSTIDSYSADGEQLLSTVGPEHTVALAAGGTVRGRLVTAYAYDQGAPAGGPYNLVTTAATSVRYTGAGGTPVDADTRTVTTGYDWTLKEAVVDTTDPAGLALTTRTSYDAEGRIDTQTGPAGGMTTNTPATRRTIYYSAAANATYPACGSAPAWDGLVCRAQVGGQPGTGPELPYTVTTYDLYGQVRATIESTSAGEQRRTTVTYDGAGRVATSDITAAVGLGTAVVTTRNVYAPDTGQLVRTQSWNASTNTVIAEIVRGYDGLGRLNSYTDADANTATITYDVASRVATTNDGKATRTYTYDGGTERRGLPTQVVDGGGGTMTASYDLDGRVTGQVWPNSIAVTETFDEVGAATSIGYVKTGCGLSDCSLFNESVTTTVHGQRRDDTSTLSAQTYGYDAAGRLISTWDTVAGACAVRVYAFAGTSGKASDRTGLTTYGPGENGGCQTTTASTTRAYTYDTADRILTAGTVYDNLGRTTTQAAADTNLPGNGDSTQTYHTNDMIRSIAQNGRTTTYSLDVLSKRLRSWTDNATGSLVTRINHYASDGDSPSWTDEGTGTWTRMVRGLAGAAAIQTGVTGNVVFQITNLHGDFVAAFSGAAVGLLGVYEQTEYGAFRNSAETGVRRYGWLGSMQRAADTASGGILMGVRVFGAAVARFLQIDPAFGGGCSAYDYGCGDPVNKMDASGSRCFIFLWGRFCTPSTGWFDFWGSYYRSILLPIGRWVLHTMNFWCRFLTDWRGWAVGGAISVVAHVAAKLLPRFLPGVGYGYWIVTGWCYWYLSG